MRKFFKTVAVVTVFSISEKFLGFLYRIFLSRSIGAEGLGLYQVTLSVFGLILTIICSGTPITVSRLMTKYKAEGQRNKVNAVISAGITSTLALAIPTVIIFFLLKNNLSFIFADDRCASLFIILLPGLVFTSVYSVLRGVFWGNKDFLPYSIIELLEEAVMIIAGVILVSHASNAFMGAFYASVAVVISFVFSFSLALIVFFIRKNKIVNPKSQLKPLLSSALPVTAMRTANSLIMSLVSIILPLRLISAGYTESQTMSIFGSAMGQSIPLLFIPTTLIGSFTLVLIPEMAENFYKKNYAFLKRDIEKALKFASLVSCLFIPLFFVCGEEIGILVFNNHESGKYLSVSAFLMLFMSLSNISTSMLNSIGLEVKTLTFFIISAVFMLLCIYFLPAVMGVYSLLVGFTFVFGLTTVLNLFLLNKYSKIKPKYVRFIFYSIGFSLPTILFSALLKNLILSTFGLFFSVLTVGICSFAFSILLYLCFNVVNVSAFAKTFKALTKKRKAVNT